jgi:hypothetical protein
LYFFLGPFLTSSMCRRLNTGDIIQPVAFAAFSGERMRTIGLARPSSGG